MSTKTIRVSEGTYHKVAKLGNLEETFDSVLDRIATEALEDKRKAISPEVVRKGSVEVQTQTDNGKFVNMDYRVIDVPARTIEMPTVPGNPAMGTVSQIGTSNNNSKFFKPKMDGRS